MDVVTIPIYLSTENLRECALDPILLSSILYYSSLMPFLKQAAEIIAEIIQQVNETPMPQTHKP